MNPLQRTRTERETLNKLEQFQKLLNADPDQAWLVKSADGKAKTLGISHVENQLDVVFFGLWSVENCKTAQHFNEITCICELVCIHPVTGHEIRRTGFSSTVITQDSGAPLSSFNETKKKNALDLAFPKLKSEALKNAAQSLGKRFGRDLNRMVEATYKPLIGGAVKVSPEALQEALAEASPQELQQILQMPLDAEQRVLIEAKLKQP